MIYLKNITHKTLLTMLASCVLLLGSCQNEETSSPIRKKMVQAVFANGHLEYENQFTLAANATGIIEGLAIKKGDSISSKRFIARIKDVGQNQSVAQSLAIYRNAAQNSSASSAQLAKLKQQVDQAQLNLSQLKINYERYTALMKTNSVARIDFENVQLEYDNAKRALIVAQKDYENAKSELQLQTSTSKEAWQAQLAVLDNYKIMSDKPGLVIDVFHKNGEVLKNGDPVALIGNGAIIIKLFVAEEDIVKVDEGQTIFVHLNTYSDRTFKARVTKIYPGFDEEQQSYTVEAVFTEIPEKLFPGTQLQANIELSGSADALVIPSTYLLPNNTVKLKSGETKTIKVGARDGQWVQVTQGLSEQDVLVKAKKNRG